jgi:GNAT superfamily N-acetyltransferase
MQNEGVTAESLPEGFEVSSDRDRVDADAAWEFLSQQAYWARWRRRADFDRQLVTAWRLVGAFRSSGEMVGFARAVGDDVSFAYLADVYVLPELRGQGLGRAVVAEMVENGPGRDFRWMLHTADMAPLYAQFGFSAADPAVMERPSRQG